MHASFLKSGVGASMFVASKSSYFILELFVLPCHDLLECWKVHCKYLWDFFLVNIMSHAFAFLITWIYSSQRVLVIMYIISSPTSGSFLAYQTSWLCPAELPSTKTVVVQPNHSQRKDPCRVHTAFLIYRRDVWHTRSMLYTMWRCNIMSA